MTFAIKGSGGTAVSITANQTSTFLVTATTPGVKGDLAVLVLAVDNNAITDGDEHAVTSVTSPGNIWLRAHEFTNGQAAIQAGATCSMWFSNLLMPMPVGSTVTVNFGDPPARDASAISLGYFTLAPNTTAVVDAVNAAANDGVVTGPLNAVTASIHALRIRATASEGNVTTVWTKTAAFDGLFAQAVTNNGVAAVNQGIRAEYDISTGTGTISDPAGGAGKVDHASVYVAFREVVTQFLAPPLCDAGEEIFAGNSAALYLLASGIVEDSDIYTSTMLYQMFDNDYVVDADVFFVPQARAYNFIIHRPISFDEIIPPSFLTQFDALPGGIGSDDEFFQSGSLSETGFGPETHDDEDGFFISLLLSDQELLPDTHLLSDLFHAPSLSSTKTLIPIHIADNATFRVPVATKGPATLSPSLFNSTDVIFSPAVNAMRPSLVTDADTFHGALGIARGPVGMAPLLVADADNHTTGMVSREPSASQLLIDTDLFHPPFMAPRRGLRAGVAIKGLKQNVIDLAGDRDRDKERAA